jgi:hypothetical protein
MYLLHLAELVCDLQLGLAYLLEVVSKSSFVAPSKTKAVLTAIAG